MLPDPARARLWREALLFARFAVVGLAATAVHMLLALALLASGRVNPYWANLGGFAVAFFVSFAGQAFWTFRTSEALPRVAPRFLLSALTCAAVSSAVLHQLLHLLKLPERPALAGAVVFFAALSYGINRLWVFRLPAPAAQRAGAAV